MSVGTLELVGYFGFGSLVNKHTLRTSYLNIVPASLSGWCRHWQARSKTFKDPMALLSIHKDDACTIKGMVVVDMLENLPLVDEREEGYSRHRLSPEMLQLPEMFNAPKDIYVYVADEVVGIKDEGVLLQSYLDAVMQGFFNAYGEEGVRHFVETTAGFERTLIKDRENPRYPRSVVLNAHECELFDTLLQQSGVTGL